MRISLWNVGPFDSEIRIRLKEVAPTTNFDFLLVYTITRILTLKITQSHISQSHTPHEPSVHKSTFSQPANTPTLPQNEKGKLIPPLTPLTPPFTPFTPFIRTSRLRFGVLSHIQKRDWMPLTPPSPPSRHPYSTLSPTHLSLKHSLTLSALTPLPTLSSHPSPHPLLLPPTHPSPTHPSPHPLLLPDPRHASILVTPQIRRHVSHTKAWLDATCPNASLPTDPPRRIWNFAVFFTRDFEGV